MIANLNSIKYLGPYLYDITFQDDEDNNFEDFIPRGSCSSYIKNGKLYRNLDWDYGETASFRIHCPRFEGMSFIEGLTDSDISNTELLNQLPYRIVDGKNNHGIMVSTHVLYNDWNFHGTGEIPLTKIPYLVLSNVTSMNTIRQDLNGVLDNLYTSPALEASEYLIQVLVSDGITSYVIRPDLEHIGNYEIVDISSNPKLANFLWVGEPKVKRTDPFIQNRPTGIERWNSMPTNLCDLRFTRAYEKPDRLSEFIGLRNTTKNSKDSDLLPIFEAAKNLYENRERNGYTWYTMHSVVYDKTGMLHLWVQEDWSHDYIENETGLKDTIESLQRQINEIKAFIGME